MVFTEENQSDNKVYLLYYGNHNFENDFKFYDKDFIVYPLP